MGKDFGNAVKRTEVCREIRRELVAGKINRADIVGKGTVRIVRAENVSFPPVSI